MKKWLAEHYSPEEAKKRWERTVALDEKWIREEGDLGGRKNAMASNMLEAYAFFAFYDSVDRSFTPEDLQSMIDAAMGKSIRMLSHFDLNKLLKHRWIVQLADIRIFEKLSEKGGTFSRQCMGKHMEDPAQPGKPRKGNCLRL